MTAAGLRRLGAFIIVAACGIGGWTVRSIVDGGSLWLLLAVAVQVGCVAVVIVMWPSRN